VRSRSEKFGLFEICNRGGGGAEEGDQSLLPGCHRNLGGGRNGVARGGGVIADGTTKSSMGVKLLYRNSEAVRVFWRGGAEMIVVEGNGIKVR